MLNTARLIYHRIYEMDYLAPALVGASLICGLRIVPRLLGQVTCPVLHQDTPAVEQVGAGIGRLDPVANHMRQGRLDHLPGMVGPLKNLDKVFITIYLYLMGWLVVSQ